MNDGNNNRNNKEDMGAYLNRIHEDNLQYDDYGNVINTDSLNQTVRPIETDAKEDMGTYLNRIHEQNLEVDDYGNVIDPDNPDGIEPSRFGEDEFAHRAKDWNHYQNESNRIAEELEKARQEQARDTKEIPPEGQNGDKTNKEVRPDELENTKKGAENRNQSLSGKTGDTNQQSESGQLKTGKQENASGESKKDKSQTNAQNKNQNGTSLGKDKDGRDIVAVKDDGTKVVKKNEKDRRADRANVKRLRMSQAKNKIDNVKSTTYMANHPIEAGKQIGKQKLKEAVLSLLKKALPYILIGLGVIMAIVMIVLLISLVYGIVAAILGQENDLEMANAGAYGFGYYDAPCQEITVTGDDAGTYSLEDYVAGVVQREVGGWNDLVVDQVFAVAARTYGLSRAAKNNCTIENSASTQVFTANPGATAIQAAQDTKGIVLTDSSGNLASTEYDALAIASRDSEYVTLKQKGQKIPTAWITAHISESTLNYYASHNHGRGMSQWGARYLAEQGENYQSILSYYYSDYTFKSTFIGTGLDGVPDYPLDSTGGTILRGQTLANFLASKGTSIEEFNALIAANVNGAGYGSRGGVVSAAVTLIGEMNKYGVKLPYVWGGGHGTISNGASASWGNGSGLDCSGFISWAIYNGGYRFNTASSGDFRNVGEVIPLDSKEAVLQPGDLLWKSGHVALVVGIDHVKREYITAEAMGVKYGVLFGRRSFNARSYKGVKMDSYYNNTGNIR